MAPQAAARMRDEMSELNDFDTLVPSVLGLRYVRRLLSWSGEFDLHWFPALLGATPNFDRQCGMCGKTIIVARNQRNFGIY